MPFSSTAACRPTPTLIDTSSLATPAVCNRPSNAGNASRTGVQRDGSSTTIATFVPTSNNCSRRGLSNGRAKAVSNASP